MLRVQSLRDGMDTEEIGGGWSAVGGAIRFQFAPHIDEGGGAVGPGSARFRPPLPKGIMKKALDHRLP